MGVDINLKWEGQTKEEHDLQITGFDIGCGHLGYLRASYNMSEELEILRKIFPNWDKKDLEFDFVKAIQKAIKEAETYLTTKECHLDFRYKIMWANSLLSFLELAIQKKKENKSPYIYVSY